MLLALGGEFSARADRIEFNDARSVVEGIILHETEMSVTVETGFSKIKIPREVIRRIVRGTDADHLLLDVKRLLRSGRTIEAIASMGRAAREGASPESLAAIIASYHDQVAAVIRRLDTEGRENLDAVLEALKTPLPFRQGALTLARLQLHLQLDDVEIVRGLLSDLERNHAEFLKRRRDSVIAWLDSRTTLALDEQRFSDALDLLVQLRRLDPRRAEGKNLDLILLWARRERDRGRFEAALELYVEELVDLSPPIARNRIADVLDEAETSFRERGELGRAIVLYEKYGLPYTPETSTGRLASLWRELGWEFLDKRQIAQARQTFGRSELLISGSAARDLLYCDYYERVAALDPKDYVGYFKLGQWCFREELLLEARSALEVAVGSGVLKSHALEEIFNIDQALDEIELKRIFELYNGTEYFIVLEELTKFLRKPLGEGYRRQGLELQALTRMAIQLADAERSQKAEVLMAQAERTYWMGEHRKSYNMLRTLMDRYSDTVAAARAQEFYRFIRPDLLLDDLEIGESMASGLLGSPEPRETDSEILEELRRLYSGIASPKALP